MKTKTQTQTQMKTKTQTQMKNTGDNNRILTEITLLKNQKKSSLKLKTKEISSNYFINKHLDKIMVNLKMIKWLN